MIKQRDVGSFAHAREYRQDVLIVAVDRPARPKQEDAGRYTVQQRDGTETSNYPGYMLEDAHGPETPDGLGR